MTIAKVLPRPACRQTLQPALLCQQAQHAAAAQSAASPRPPAGPFQPAPGSVTHPAAAESPVNRHTDQLRKLKKLYF